MTSTKGPSLSGRYRFRLLTVALVSAVVVIEILVLALMENNFNLRKKEIIIEKKRPLTEIQRRMKAIRTSGSPQSAVVKEEIKRASIDVKTLISQPDFPAIYFEVTGASDVLLFRDESIDAEVKRKKFNTWSNCLFTRNFEFTARGTVSEGYEVWVHLVSWPDIDEVHELVIEYRGYALLFTLSNILIAFLLFSGAIRPLARIARALASPPDQPPPIIARPKHEVERAYNSMARGTRLTAVHFDLSDLGEHLGEEAHSLPGEDLSFWDFAANLVRKGMGYERVVWMPFSEGIITSQAISSRDTEKVEDEIVPPHPEDLAWFANGSESEGDLLYQPGTGGPFTPEDTSGNRRIWFGGIVQRRGERIGLLLAAVTQNEDAPALALPYFRGLVRQLGLVLTRSLERLEALDRGRYEVSIDLSASMGHDLTNILATGRLELETLRTAFRRGIIEVPGEKKEMVHAAVEGLRKTTVLLQEVVNVYRAFSYTREPQFERVDLNSLVQEVIDLYRHSTSRQVTYEFVEGEESPCAQADPRLLKLVLFNLLANATQAIAERQSERPTPPGKVEISCGQSDGWAVLRVEDNGTGFQNPFGQRLEGVELQQIFHFDFTTKKRQGGLGLAWVHSIIVDIHQGRLVPSNRGHLEGAVMEVFLKTPSELSPPPHE
jgi:signal transduction histidine kinase